MKPENPAIDLKQAVVERLVVDHGYTAKDAWAAADAWRGCIDPPNAAPDLKVRLVVDSILHAAEPDV